MRARLSWAFAGVGVCVLVATLVAAAPGDKPKSAWEYKFTTGNGPSVPGWDEGVNKLGAEGWELVTATAVPTHDGNKEYVLYFKRTK